MIPCISPETERNPTEMLDGTTGVAWLSSARAVGCSLKWGNERNPFRVLHYSRDTVPLCGEEAGTTSSQHGPYVWGNTHTTMGPTNRCQVARRS